MLFIGVLSNGGEEFACANLSKAGVKNNFENKKSQAGKPDLMTTK
jgi:hypothetical protein